MNRLLLAWGLLALLLAPAFVVAQPITRFARFTGNINFVATGGSLRTQSNAGDPCAVGTTSSQALSGIPVGSSIVAAYLYWGGSGATADTSVTLNGSTVTAARTFSSTFLDTTTGNSFPFFGGFADVTSRITGSGTLTFGGLTVNTGAPYCASSAVAAGWAVIAIYGSASERLRAVNVFDGLQYFRGSAVTLNPDGFRIPSSNIDGRMAIVAWEGDPGNSTALNGFSEALSFNGSTVDDGIVVAGSDPAVQPYDGTVNSLGVANSYGVDVDTFDVSTLLSPGQTSATTQFSSGGDLVLLTAQVVSATSEPVVDLSLTKTHTGNFTVGANNTYRLNVANAAGVQREDNAVTVTDVLPAGLGFVSGAGTGWSCAAAGQNVTCTHPPPLDPGASLPQLTMTVTAAGAAVPNVTNTATVASASFDINASNNSASDATVVVGSNLSTSTKTVVDSNGGDPDPGDTLRYTITLRETNGVAANGVSVVDDLASELTSLNVVSVPAGATNFSTGTGGANGTGRVDVRGIALPANGSATIVFDVRIASGTAPGTPLNNSATVTNPGGPGATPAAPQLIVSPSAIPSAGTKPLYLRTSPSVVLSRTPPAADAAVTVAFGTPVTWTLSPALALPLTLPAGNIAVPLWLARTGTGTRTVVVTLANSAAGTIGTATQTVTLNTGTPLLSTFVIANAATTTFPVGSTFSVTLTQTAPNVVARSTQLYPLGATVGDYSRVSLPSATVINVDSVQTFSAAYNGGSALASFYPGDTVYVRATISDPFGNFDIASANASIVDTAGTVRLASAAMTAVASPTTATRLYELAYMVPAAGPLGGWSARVTGVEGTEGVVMHTRAAGFTVVQRLPALRVQKTVAVLTDPVRGSTNPHQIPGSVQRYQVAVTNTGTGTVDASTLVIVDPIPSGAAMYVSTAAGTPVVFVDGSVASNLSFNYAANVSYSNQLGGVAPFTYVPVPDANGFDANVTAVRIGPTGTLAGASGASQPSFTVEFAFAFPDRRPTKMERARQLPYALCVAQRWLGVMRLRPLQRRVTSIRLAVLLYGVLTIAGAAAQQPGAEKAWTPTRTPDGQPDLQGIWVNFDSTPFEADTSLAQSDLNPPSHWTDHDSPMSPKRRSMVVEPPEGRVPVLKWAEDKRDYDLAHLQDAPWHETPWVRCITRGVPAGMFPAGYNNAYEIMQIPGYVVIAFEMIHDTRIIPLDGRPHVGHGIRLWNGDPRGYFEGNTLIVETTNFNDKGSIATSAATGRMRGIPQSDELSIVERFTRIDANTINYSVTVTDPKVYAQPWTVALPLNRDERYQMFEYACQEGNLALPGELRAGRAREKAAHR